MRAVVDRHGESFLTPGDMRTHKNANNHYKFGIGSMIMSLPASYYFAQQISRNKEKAGTYMFRNMAISTTVVLGFTYAVWKKGKVEEKLGDKYLWMLSDQELKHFEDQSHILLHRVRQASHANQGYNNYNQQVMMPRG